MAYTFNIFTGNFDAVSKATDTTPGGVADVWLLEDVGGWLLEDGSGYWILEA